MTGIGDRIKTHNKNLSNHSYFFSTHSFFLFVNNKNELFYIYKTYTSFESHLLYKQEMLQWMLYYSLLFSLLRWNTEGCKQLSFFFLSPVNTDKKKWHVSVCWGGMSPDDAKKTFGKWDWAWLFQFQCSDSGTPCNPSTLMRPAMWSPMISYYYSLNDLAPFYSKQCLAVE